MQFKENGFDKHNNQTTLLRLNISSLLYPIDEFTELLCDLKINFKVIGITESLTQKFARKLYKMYTKIIQNTKFVYILYTKIVKIKISYDNECTNNVHQIPTYIQKMYTLYKTCTKCKLKRA